MSLIDKIKQKKATICIVGVGYVGLPNAVSFVEKGFTVIAADASQRVVDLTNAGKSHINDPALNESVPKAFATGRLNATQDVATATKKSDVVIISVPTPTKGNQPDLTYIENASHDISRGLTKDKLVILESTVYPSTCNAVIKPILEASGLKCGKDFLLAHCPERLNPGDNEHSVKKTHRIVGGFDEQSGKTAKTLYEQIIDANIMQVSSLDTAELVKLVENTQRDLNIAYMNEIALICEKIGVDVKEIITACKTKWNFYPAMPGPGVGGHCLPNNPYYILKRAEEKGFHPRLIMLGRQVNDSMQYHTIELISEALNEIGKPIKGTRIALLGVSYKANVDDVRQAPSRVIAEELRKRGANLVITDPHVNEANMKKVHHKTVSLEEALQAECLVFLCNHDEYKKIDLNKTKAKAVVDTAFLFDDFKGVYKRVGKGN